MADEGELPGYEMGRRVAPKLRQDRRMSLWRKFLPMDETCGQWGKAAGALQGGESCKGGHAQLPCGRRAWYAVGWRLGSAQRRGVCRIVQEHAGNIP
jgi:hypothetical protein